MASRKTALVMGVANGRSIAWECARSLWNKNYNVVVTYQNERFQPQVQRLIDQHFLSYHHHHQQQQHQQTRTATATPKEEEEEQQPHHRMSLPWLQCLPCQIETEVPLLFQERVPHLLYQNTNTNTNTNTNHHHPTTTLLASLDAIVHSVAYAPTTAMKGGGGLLHTSREDFAMAHDISAYSLIEVARHALPLLQQQPPPSTDSKYSSSRSSRSSSSSSSSSSSITALTYLGSTRTVANYNVMGPAKASLEAIVRGLACELGSVSSLSSSDQPPPRRPIRVNAVSAGPIRTLAAKGISNFDDMYQKVRQTAPLQRNVTTEQVADTVTFVATEAQGMTGQTVFCDAGVSIVG